MVQQRLESLISNPALRDSVVIGLRVGSGFGKTHLLTEAPSLLGAQGLYVTYNGDQNVECDVALPVKTLLIRLILMARGCSQNLCETFILSKACQPFLDVDTHTLRKGFVNFVKQKFKGKEAFISVDEIMMLGENGAKEIVSELRKISEAYFTIKPTSICMCMVSSLVDKAFRTKSGRSVEPLVPKRPDRSALEHFAAYLPTENKVENMTLMNAVSGSHIRSIRIAYDSLAKGNTPSVRGLLTSMIPRMGNKIIEEEFGIIRGYLEGCIRDKDHKPPSVEIDTIEQLTGEDRSVPPAIMLRVFQERDGYEEHSKFLNAFSLFYGGPGKHLEELGKWYD